MKLKNNIIPFILFLGSFFLRLSLISKGPFNVDCLDLATQAERSLSAGQLQNMYGSGYPLVVILSAGLIYIFRMINIVDPVSAVNMMSVVTTSICVIFFYKIAERITSQKAAIFSTILFSLNPAFLGNSVFGISHGPALLFLSVSIYFLILFKEDNKCLKYLFISAIFFGFTGAARLQDMIFLIIPIASLILIPLKPCNIKIFLLFSLIAAAFCALFYLPYIITDAREDYFSQLRSYRADSLPVYSLEFIRYTFLELHGYLCELLLPVGLCISICGLFILGRKKNSYSMFIYLWFFVSFYILIIFSTTRPRFLLLSLMPLSIAAGECLSYLFNFNRVFKFVSIIMLCLLFRMGFLPTYYLLKFRHRVSVIIEYCKWLNKNTEKNSLIITCDDKPFIRYYGSRESLARPMNTFSISIEQLEMFKKGLDKKIEEGYPVYITDIGLYAYAPKGEFTSFFRHNYRIVPVGKSLYEDWHQGASENQLFYNNLYKVTKN